MLSVEEQLRVITSGTMQIVPLDGLKEKLKKGTPLNIKLGVDPTSPDLHLGHAVPLRKMRQFQDLGHNVTLIIGSGTALIGDPSGRDSTRPPLTSEQVDANAETYVNQAMKILDPERTTVVHNGDWIKPMNLETMLGLMSKFTIARIEMGGNDQIFNLLAGRDLMRDMDMEPQIALTMPLLVGTDGTKKMSKSYGNYIGLTDEPNDMFGKVMSITDEIIPMYYRLCSTLSIDELDAIDKSFEDGTADPYQLKRALGRNIVDLYHGEGEGLKAQAAFDAQFKNNEVPDDVKEFAISLEADEDGLIYLPKILVEVEIASSNGEARRLIDGGGIKINQQPLPAKTYKVEPAVLEKALLQAGKKRWAQLV